MAYLEDYTLKIVEIFREFTQRNPGKKCNRKCWKVGLTISNRINRDLWLNVNKSGIHENTGSRTYVVVCRTLTLLLLFHGPIIQSKSVWKYTTQTLLLLTPNSLGLSLEGAKEFIEWTVDASISPESLSNTRDLVSSLKILTFLFMHGTNDVYPFN